jgi:hypothetical protein
VTIRSEYQGLTAAQAEAEARKLLRAALDTGRWFDLPDRLSLLRAIIQQPSDRQSRMGF